MDVAGLPVLVDGLTAANGIVYAGSGKAFGAYNGKTGDAVWLNKGWPQGEATTSTPLLANGVVISGANWRGFYGNDAQTGELLWKLDKDGITDRGATPAYDGNLLYVTSRQSLFIIDCHSGEVIVRKELPFNVQVNSTPLVTDKLIVSGRRLMAWSHSTVRHSRSDGKPGHLQLWFIRLPIPAIRLPRSKRAPYSSEIRFTSEHPTASSMA